MPKTSRSLRLCGWGIYFLLECFSPAWADEKRIDCVTDQVPTASEFSIAAPEPGVVEFVRAFRFNAPAGPPLRIGARVQVRSVEGRAPEARAFSGRSIPRGPLAQAIAPQVLDTTRPITNGGAFRLPRAITGPSLGATTVANQLTELIMSALSEQIPGWLGQIQIDIEFWMRSQTEAGSVSKLPLRIAVQGSWTRDELAAQLLNPSLQMTPSGEIVAVTATEAIDRLRTGRLRILLERLTHQAGPRVVSVQPGTPPSPGPGVVTLQIQGERQQLMSMLPPSMSVAGVQEHPFEDAVLGALFGDALVLPARMPTPSRGPVVWRLPTHLSLDVQTPEALLGGSESATAEYRAQFLTFGRELQDYLTTTGRRLSAAVPLTDSDRARAVGLVQEGVRRIREFRAQTAAFRRQPNVDGRPDLVHALQALDVRLQYYENSLRNLIRPTNGRGPDFGLLGRGVFDRCIGFRGDFWEYVALFFVPHPIAIRLRPRVGFEEFTQAFQRLRDSIGGLAGNGVAPTSVQEFKDRLKAILSRRHQDRALFGSADTVLNGEMDVLFVDVDHRAVAMEVKTVLIDTAPGPLVQATVDQLRRDRIFMEAMGIDVSRARFAVYLPARDRGGWTHNFRTRMRLHGFTDDQILVFIGQPR